MSGPTDWINDDDDGAAGPEPSSVETPELPLTNSLPTGALPGVLSVQEARELLLRQHGLAISEQDPLLMIVTLFGRVLQDYQRLLAKHDQEMAEAIATSAAATAKAVDESLETLKDKTVRAGINGTLALVERQAVAVADTLSAIRRVRRSIAALAVINWLAAGVSISLLWAVLK